MKITVNGELQDVPEQSTISMLLGTLKLDPKVTVVMHNDDIVERVSYVSTVLADGDTIELVRFVGGG